MGKKGRTVPMNISVPASLKQELKRHPETNWSRVAARAFEEHLEAVKLLAHFAEPGLSDEEILKRALSVQHGRSRRKDWGEIFKTMDAKKLKVSEKEVIDEIAAVRRERHKVSSRKRQITTS